MNKTFCLVTGISPDKIQKGLASAEGHILKDAPDLAVYMQFMRTSMLQERISDITEIFWKNPITMEETLNDIPSDILTRRGKVVIIQSFLKDHVFAIMRGIKSVSSRPQDIIFAMLTETAATWTLEEYLKHLKAEHSYMKTHPPEHDADMRRM